MTSLTVVVDAAPFVRSAWEQDFAIDSEDAIRRFATAIGDRNPVHHNDEAAKARGLLGIVAPGVMTMGFVSATIAEEIPGVVLASLQVAFKKPLYAGSLPTVRCTVTEQRRRLVMADIEVRNGAEIVAQGNCTLILPK